MPTTWTHATENATTWTQGTENSTTFNFFTESGAGWLYDDVEQGLTYESSGYNYNSRGSAATWTHDAES